MNRADTPSSPHRRASHTGYSLIEVMVCVLIVGGMFAAAVHTLGAVRLGERQAYERARGHMLAQAVMDALLQKPYDELDAYHEWSSAPPTMPDGTATVGFDDWSVRVTVHNADPDEPERTATSETGLKRVIVTVRRDEAVLAESTALRGRGMEKERPTGAIAP